jgi:hypothetical protein
MTQSAVPHLLAAFPPPDFYRDEIAVRQAVARRDMFNLMDITGGDKVDFWVLGDYPYNKECFARRYLEEVGGVGLYVQQPEDTILSKLRWAAIAGGSEKQFTDALRVFEVQYGRLDLTYMDHWARELGLAEAWERLQAEVEPE